MQCSQFPSSWQNLFNPIPAIVPFMGRSAKILISIYGEIIKKISNERSDHESVDEKNLF